MDRSTVYALISALLWAFLASVRSATFRDHFRSAFGTELPTRAVPWIALAAGVGACVIDARIAGAPFSAQEILTGLAVGAGAIGLHESLGKLAKGPGGSATLLCLALALGGCRIDPLVVAADVANAAASAGSAAEPVIRVRCVEGMARASTPQAVADLAAVCDPIVTAYEALRTSHVALRAAIVVAASGGAVPDLAAFVGQTGAAAATFSRAMIQIHGGAK